MSLIAELQLSGDIGVFDYTYNTVPDINCAVEDFHHIQEDGTRHSVLFGLCQDCEFDTLETAMEEDPTIREWYLVAEIDSRHLYRIETVSFPSDQPLLFPACRRHDITVLSTRRDTEGLHLRARVPSRETLQRFSHDLDNIADQFTLTQLYVEGQRPDGADRLTDKQHKALALAFEHGYFETPSQITLEELADQCEVTAQALSDRIRSAVQTLVANAVANDTGPRYK